MNIHVNRSIPEVAGDVLHQFTTLLRKEGQLARAELSEKVSHAGYGIALAIFGAVLFARHLPKISVEARQLILAQGMAAGEPAQELNASSLPEPD